MNEDDSKIAPGDFDVFKCRTVVEGVLRAVTQVHIGAATTRGSTDNPVIRVRIGNEEVPYIPGSSVKGVVRSHLEPLLSGVSGGERVVQYLFGSAGKDTRVRGHVAFVDCHPLEPVAVHTKPGVAIDRTTGAASPRKKYDIETVAPGTRFSFKLIMENIDIRDDTLEAKAMRLVLSELKNSRIAIGGKTTSGLGVVSLDITRVAILTADDVRGLRLEYRDITDEVVIE